MSPEEISAAPASREDAQAPLTVPPDICVSQPAVPAMAAGFVYPFRRYQRLALDAFETGRTANRERCYVVMPAGSGKTVVGLEIARRLGRKTVVFGPNTAIQSQWITQWRDFEPTEPASSNTQLDGVLSVLTYQSLCSMNGDVDELVGAASDEQEEPAGSPGPIREGPGHDDHNERAAMRRRQRQLVIHGGDRAALLALLHPHGRELIERMKAESTITLVLDECHHLLETWGHLVQALVDELGDRVFVVGLTATPPADMGAREAELYRRLFGRADFDVVTPAVVKEGDLAPYQELAYLTQPLPTELEYMASLSRRFDGLISALTDPTFASRPFLDWLHQRLIERQDHSGARVSWARFEQDEPDLAQAGIRLFLARGLQPPPEAHIGERHRQAPSTDDWVVMIEDYARGFLARSDVPVDAQAWQRIRHILPSVGFVLTHQGIRTYVSPSDRVLALSASKAAAAQTILDIERQWLGAGLRALILCDFERAGMELLAELRSILDPQAGSASLILQLLATDATTRSTEPMLLTGRTVACARRTAVAFVEWASEEVPELAPALAALPLAPTTGDGEPSWDEVVIISPETVWWQPRHYVPLVTRFLEAGRTRCLIGTRGLLGEGWDAHSVNVLIDLTAATTSTSVHQMRGRSLRLDPSIPRKVADNWDVVCVAPGVARGTTDYARFVRKPHNYYALTETGEIEMGVSHVDPALSPYGPPAVEQMQALNERALARTRGRDRAYADWKIGEPYRNVGTETVRLHFNRSLGLPEVALRASTWRLDEGVPRVLYRVGLSWLIACCAMFFVGFIVAAAAAAVTRGGDLAGPLTGTLGAGLTIALLGGVPVRRAIGMRDKMTASRPTDSLESLATVVVEALAETDGIDRRLNRRAVRLVVQPDGYYRCYLEGASAADSRLFADSLDQVLSPIEDPRYVIGRWVVEPPSTRLDAWKLAWACARGRPSGARLVYHAVPDYLGTNVGRARSFERLWRTHVGGTAAVFCRDPKGAGIIEARRGEDPFATTSQMRTLWS